MAGRANNSVPKQALVTDYFPFVDGRPRRWLWKGEKQSFVNWQTMVG